MSKKIILGSRGSRLAMIQAESIAAGIREASPATEVEVHRIITRGDRNRHIPLENAAGIGIFVKEIEEALLDGRIDLAVHSLKDMPTELPEGLIIAAITERLDPADVLITRGDKLDELPPGARIGTGSPRRSAQVTGYRTDLKTVSIRGNVDTRIGKVTSREVDGVILAAAAMKRLGWEDRITEYLPVEHFLPAVGQGALAIETRTEEEIIKIVALLNHQPSRQRVTAERAFLRALGGGCQAPIAALATVNGDTLKLEGMTVNPATNRMLRGTEEGDPISPEAPGEKLAERLLAEGADKF
ncbi:MAG: hydroxymethylbilane synthase [Dehalococcoidales bacterium]